MLNQYKVSMYYSAPRTGQPDGRTLDTWARSDWICSKCGAHNFKRRDYCFKCSISKEESEKAKDGDGFEQVGNNPCNTLVLRGLDALTTEENIIAALGRISSLTVKNIKVIRDTVTNTSRGYAFAELQTIQDSSQLLEVITNMQSPFEVDGKAILVAFAKNTFTTVMATMSQWSQQPQQAGSWEEYYAQAAGQDPATPSTTATGYYDQNGHYYEYDYSAYYGQEYPPGTQPPPPGTTPVHPPAADGKSSQSDTTNAAAAVAQAAIQQAQAVKQYQKQYVKQHEEMQKQFVALVQQQNKLEALTPEERLAQEAQQWSQQQDSPPSGSTASKTKPKEYTKYPVPDVSTYQFDEASGYYYDPVTSLYYDANSQYYYNATTQQFMYWDGEKQTYLPAPKSDQTGTPPAGLDPNNPKDDERKSKKDKEKKEKVKVAKKIAKDMEKWAKSLNAQKEALKDGFKRSFQSLGSSREEKESASADAGFAILEKRSVIDRNKPFEMVTRKEERKLMPPPPMPGGKGGDQPGLVASYGGDSDDDEEQLELLADGSQDDSRLLDYSKLACLLCKRQFPTKEALQRHQQMSDLHKKNLEELLKKKGVDSVQQAIQYRDRARERRQKYGQPEPPQPHKRGAQESGAPEPFEQPTKAGIGQDNIGNKLLQKMGWSAGQGLGKTNQGITDPIQAMKRSGGASGLGTRGSNYNVTPGDTYKDTVKKVMFARYQELETDDS